MADRTLKIIVRFERREDGGLRAWSDDLPGLVLSHRDVDAVLEDVVSAIRVMLAELFGDQFEVRPLGNIREALEADGLVQPPFIPGPREYVALLN